MCLGIFMKAECSRLMRLSLFLTRCSYALIGPGRAGTSPRDRNKCSRSQGIDRKTSVDTHCEDGVSAGKDDTGMRGQMQLDACNILASRSRYMDGDTVPCFSVVLGGKSLLPVPGNEKMGIKTESMGWRRSGIQGGREG
ncbi:hypothetical protein QBC39DRAFT_361496 [Podospora conica]|nr:hypothetical protein QBC39DRAFT_361496 [Schizothecium conicum]